MRDETHEYTRDLDGRRRRRGLALVVAALASVSMTAHAQGDSEARRLLETGQQHYDAQRYAEAATSYMQAYDVMHSADHPRASLALWNAGRAMSFVPGRECEARDTLQRFLRESHALADDAVVSDDRSEALALIPQLEARGHCGASEGAQDDEASRAGTELGTHMDEGLMIAGGVTFLVGYVGAAITIAAAHPLYCGGTSSVSCESVAWGFVPLVHMVANGFDGIIAGLIGLVMETVGVGLFIGGAAHHHPNAPRQPGEVAFTPSLPGADVAAGIQIAL